MSGITYYNPQINGDMLSAEYSTNSADVCGMVVEAYQRGMMGKIRTGVQGRLRAAYDYQSKDRVDKMVFHAVEKDGQTEEDCDDCDNELFSVNIDFIRLQFDTAMSIYQNALKTRGNDYCTVDPTPIPDTDDNTKKRISEQAHQSILRDIATAVVGRSATPQEEQVAAIAVLEGLLGTQEGLEQINEFVARQRMIEVSKLQGTAQKKAANAKIFLDDKLTESNYDQVMHESAANAFWYDYSVVYAPYTIEKDTTVIKNGKLVESSEKVWAMQNINPVNHFYSETTTFYEMGDYEGDVTWMSRNDIKQIGALKGGDAQLAAEVIDSFMSYQQLLNNAGDIEEEYDDSIWAFNDRAPVIRIMIRLDDEQVKKLFPQATLKTGKASHIVEMMCVRDKLLYKKLYPRYKEYNPYRKNAFTMIGGSNMSSGRGLYSICRTAQEMIDNSLIGIFDNMQELNKYILEVNETKLSDPDEFEDNLEAERPIIRTKGIANFAQYGGNDRAIHLIQIPDNIGAFTNTLLRGIELMERVGFSAFALGQGNFSNVRSNGQSAILQANSNKRFNRFLQQQEEFVETPIIDYIWTAEAISGEAKGILVDSTISVKSYSGFLQKEGQATEVGLFMQNLVGFMDKRALMLSQGQDVGFFDGLLRQYVDASGFDAEGLDITPDVAGIVDGLGAGNQDIVAAPLQSLDGRSNINPATVNATV